MMSRFTFHALSATGERLSETIEARSRSDVLDKLQRAGHLVIDVREHASEVPVTTPGGRLTWANRPGKKRVTALTRDLSMLLEASVPLSTALGLLADETRTSGELALLAQLRAALNDGKSLQEALKEHPAIFPASYTGIVRAGEESGQLGAVLSRIAAAREADEKLGEQVLSATIYPMFLILTALSAVLVLLTFVVPKFKTMIVNTQATIPDDARLVIEMSDWLREHQAAFIVSVALTAAVLAIASRARRVRLRLNAMLLHFPLVRHFIKLAVGVRFCQSMGTLLQCGVELPRALQLTADMFEQPRMVSAINAAHEALRKGEDFTEPLKKSGLMLPVAITMLRLAQETGDLGATFLRLASIFSDKLQVAIRRFFTILEPSIVILVSLIVAGIIMTILGAVISVNDLVL